MALEKFELKEEHVKLLTHLKFNLNEKSLSSTIEYGTPYGGDDFYEDCSLILFGVKKVSVDLKAESIIDVSEEDKSFIDKIYSELPKALNVILNTNSFEIGKYKTKFGRNNWKKI
jgi:hypothetical protein